MPSLNVLGMWCILSGLTVLYRKLIVDAVSWACFCFGLCTGYGVLEAGAPGVRGVCALFVVMRQYVAEIGMVVTENIWYLVHFVYLCCALLLFHHWCWWFTVCCKVEHAGFFHFTLLVHRCFGLSLQVFDRIGGGRSSTHDGVEGGDLPQYLKYNAYFCTLVINDGAPVIDNTCP